MSTNLLLLTNEQNTSRISKSETQWLDELNVEVRQYKIKFQNCYIFVDGFDEATNTIYEFFGDYWHCNPDLYKDDYFNEIKLKTAKQIREEDSLRFKIFRELGYNIKFVWENDYKKKKLLYSEFNDYLI